jgi:hypothetical protein
MRSIPYFAMALVSWTLVWRFFGKGEANWFRLRVGFQRVPGSALYQAARAGGFVAALAGMPMLVIDFTRWIKNTKA